MSCAVLSVPIYFSSREARPRRTCTIDNSRLRRCCGGASLARVHHRISMSTPTTLTSNHMNIAYSVVYSNQYSQLQTCRRYCEHCAICARSGSKNMATRCNTWVRPQPPPSSPPLELHTALARTARAHPHSDSPHRRYQGRCTSRKRPLRQQILREPRTGPPSTHAMGRLQGQGA